MTVPNTSYTELSALYMMQGSEIECEETVVATTIDLGGMNNEED